MLAINAFYVAGEFALVTVERSHVSRQAEEGDRRAQRVQEGLTSLSFHLSGAQLGITVSSLLLGVIAEPALGSLFHPVFERFSITSNVAESLTVVAALGFATGLQLVFGELVPKNLAITYPYPTAMRIGVPVLLANRLFSPIIRFLNSTANAAVRRLGIEPREELAGVRSLEELELIIRASGEGGALSDDELSLLTRSISFTENLASDVMIPRVRIVGLPQEATVAEAQKMAVETGHSRFPVFGSGLDNILGVLHIKDTLRVPWNSRATAAAVDHTRPVLQVPESQSADSLLVQLRAQGVGLAIVVDEYGGTAGMVTVEDLVEEILGDIEDEHDPEATPSPRPDGELSGMLHRHEVAELTGFEWPEGRYETLGGFFTAHIGRQPVNGDVVTMDGWKIEALRLDGLRVDLLRVTPTEEPE